MDAHLDLTAASEESFDVQYHWDAGMLNLHPDSHGLHISGDTGSITMEVRYHQTEAIAKRLLRELLCVGEEWDALHQGMPPDDLWAFMEQAVMEKLQRDAEAAANVAKAPRMTHINREEGGHDGGR